MGFSEPTGGPWRVAGPERAADGTVVDLARVIGPEHLDSRGEPTTTVAHAVSTPANAQLMAAAPDLYEAAKPLAQLLSRLETHSSLRSGSFIGDQYKMKEVTAADLRKLRDAVERVEGRARGQAD
jgi:hypothetical protein